MSYIELKEPIPWRTFQLKDEPELIHIKKIREEEYMVVHEDAYGLKTGEVEFFFSKLAVELNYKINL